MTSADVQAMSPVVFDYCDRLSHYAACPSYTPFEACQFGRHWHYVIGEIAYRCVDQCPESDENHNPAERACEVPGD